MDFVTLKFLFFPIFFNIQNIFFVCLFIPVFGILCLLYSDYYDLEFVLQEKIRKFVKYLQLFGTILNIYNLYMILSHNINFEIFL
jgi:hypothetical protein